MIFLPIDGKFLSGDVRHLLVWVEECSQSTKGGAPPPNTRRGRNLLNLGLLLVVLDRVMRLLLLL